MNVSSGQFEQQMLFLKNIRFNCLSLSEPISDNLIDRRHFENNFILTFDDGYDDIYENAFPILKKFGFVATIFVIAQPVKGGNHHYLSWQKLMELAKNNFAIGSHALTHSRLSNLNSKTIKYELQKSKNIIEDRLGQSVELLAYPYGDSNERVRAIAQECGYRAAFGTNSGKWSTYNQWRIPVKEHESKLIFYLKARGLYYLFLQIREQTILGRITRKWKEGRG